MATKVEGRTTAEFIISEGNRFYSRDTVTIASGSGVLAPGAVLGKITASGKFSPSAATGTDGSQVAAAVLHCACDATSADVQATAIIRTAEVFGTALSYAASVDDAAKKAAKATQLAAVGIIVR